MDVNHMERVLPKEVKEVLYDEAAIDAFCFQLAQRIIHTTHTDQQIILVPILAGALPLAAELLKRLPDTTVLAPICASSRRDGRDPGMMSITIPLATQTILRSAKRLVQRVVIVDEIIDTGNTMRQVLLSLESINNRISMHIVALFYRAQEELGAYHTIKGTGIAPNQMLDGRMAPTDICRYVHDDSFLVGFGLDYGGQFRGLPYVGILKDDV